jgi:predicted DNA-binding transcriptional regulator AlpA
MPAAQRNKNSRELYLKYNSPRQPPADIEFLTSHEVAYLLRVSRKVIMEYAARKKKPLPSIHLSKSVIRFSREAVIQWAASNQGKFQNV